MSERKDGPPAPTRGVAVELDRQRFLRYPLSVLKQLQRDGESKSLGEVIWIGLKGDDPTLTVEQVDDMIDLENLHTLFGPVKRATGGLIDLSRLFRGVQQDPPSPPPAAESSAST